MVLKRQMIIIVSVFTLLLIPLVLMQFTQEVAWSLFDFIVMGILLLSIGLGIDFILRKTTNKSKRLLFIALLILAFLLIWGELSVGIFGTPFAGS
jgi:hypothetical protein